MPAEPNEEGVPPGTYLTSCEECKFVYDIESSEKMLQCTRCSKECGTKVVTNKISVGACESFGNSDGMLVCDNLPTNEWNLPNGTYKNSCGGCKLENSNEVDDNDSGGVAVHIVLSCLACKDSNGETHSSTLIIERDSGCNRIGNREGSLVCEEDMQLEEDAELPEGTYKDSCSGCLLTSGGENNENHDDTAYGVLSCSACKDGQGETHTSTLRIEEEGDCLAIGNREGVLLCEDNRQAEEPKLAYDNTVHTEAVLAELDDDSEEDDDVNENDEL